MEPEKSVPQKSGQRRCPSCDEPSPTDHERCLACGEQFRYFYAPAERAALLERARSGLLVLGEEERRPLLGRRTIVILLLQTGCLAMIVYGLLDASDILIRALPAAGILGSVFLGPALFLSFLCDYRCNAIQGTPDVIVTVRRYFTALIANRPVNAYACVVPSGRRAERQTLSLSGGSPLELDEFEDSSGFSRCCATLWKTLEKASVEEVCPVGEGLSLARVELVFDRSFSGVGLPRQTLGCILAITFIPPFLPYLTIPAVLLYLLLRRREHLSIQKLLMKHGEKWFIVEGALEGPLDRMWLPEDREES